MREITEDIWKLYEQGKNICIPTNGFVKKDGSAVMGAGVAKQAASRFPNLPKMLGEQIKECGNIVQFILPNIIAFPVKPIYGYAAATQANVVRPFSPGDWVPGWAMKADLEIIQRSLYELDFINAWGRRSDPRYAGIFLPRPGCGAGGLSWEKVQPLCTKYGDWLTIVSLEKLDDF